MKPVQSSPVVGLLWTRHKILPSRHFRRTNFLIMDKIDSLMARPKYNFGIIAVPQLIYKIFNVEREKRSKYGLRYIKSATRGSNQQVCNCVPPIASQNIYGWSFWTSNSRHFSRAASLFPVIVSKFWLLALVTRKLYMTSEKCCHIRGRLTILSSLTCI